MQQYVAVVQFKCEAENVVARIKLMNGKHNHTICTVCMNRSAGIRWKLLEIHPILQLFVKMLFTWMELKIGAEAKLPVVCSRQY